MVTPGAANPLGPVSCLNQLRCGGLSRFFPCLGSFRNFAFGVSDAFTASVIRQMGSFRNFVVRGPAFSASSAPVLVSNCGGRNDFACILSESPLKSAVHKRPITTSQIIPVSTPYLFAKQRDRFFPVTVSVPADVIKFRMSVRFCSGNPRFRFIASLLFHPPAA